MVVYVGESPDIQRKLDELSDEFKVPWTPNNIESTDDLYNAETAILQRMARAAIGRYLFLTNLDTLPYRDNKQGNRLQEVFQLLRTHRLAFFTASALRYKADRPIASNDGHYLLTHRFSNNCGLIEKTLWFELMAKHASPHQSEALRFHSEWAIEEEVRISGQLGLRRVDSRVWRVFHIQQWDDNLYRIRERFRAGKGIQPFLGRIADDYRHPWEVYYGYPKPSAFKRHRIRFGEWRRGFLQS